MTDDRCSEESRPAGRIDRTVSPIARPERRRWGPTRGVYRPLAPREGHAYGAHLRRLTPDDRRQRFHRVMSDTAVTDHAAATLGAGVARVIGWHEAGVLRGATEICFFDSPFGPAAEAAFALERPYRGRRIGAALMARAVRHAQNARARRLYVTTDPANRPMLRLARAAGARIDIMDGAADGVLETPRRTALSLCLETADAEIGWLGWLIDRAHARWRGMGSAA